MRARLIVVALTLAFAGPAFAGCFSGNDSDSDGRTVPTADNLRAYTVTTTGVPAQVAANAPFSFTLTADGEGGASSDHIGAHYGKSSSTAPSTQVYDKACDHQADSVPGSLTITCRIAEGGTWYLRGHLRLTNDNGVEDFWGPEVTITVNAPLTVKVGTEAAFPPFEDIDSNGDFVGFDMDLVREVAKRNGWTLDLQNLGFDVLIPSVQNGQIDIAISAMTITEARSQVVDFTIAYYEANQSVSVRAADSGKYASLDDMKGKGLKFGAQAGTTGEDIIIKTFGEDARVRYDSYPLAIEALKQGDVAAVVMDEPAQREAAKSDTSIVVAFQFSTGETYGMAVKKGRLDFLNQLNDALEAMHDDGTISSLKTKWGI